MDVLGKLRLPVPPLLPADVVRLNDLLTGGEVNYSLSPVNTLVRWADQSPVYRIVYITRCGPNPGVNNEVGEAQAFVGLVRVQAFAIGPDQWYYPAGYYAGTTTYFSVMVHQSGKLAEQHGHASLNNARLIVILDYIPSTTDLSIWDFGTSSWDGGNSVWDKI